MAMHKQAEAVLAMWREIERSLEKAEPGSAEFERLASDAVMLRDEYQRMVAEARDRDVSLPLQDTPTPT